MYENRIMKPVKMVYKGEDRKKKVTEGVNIIKYIVHIYGTITMKPLYTIAICE
jgi:hypothetical protein